MSNDSKRCRLSVALIVRDAETIIEQTLRSVTDIVDEIIVADTGSRDRTRRIVAPWARRVVDVPWRHDFSAARNACLAEARGEWVLWLDAGETISADTALDLRRFVDRSADPRTAYSLLVRLPQSPSAIGAQQIARMRLMPNHEGLEFDGRVRECVNGSAASAGLSRQELDLVINRHARDHESEIRVRRAQRNLKLVELELAAHGQNARLLLVRGESFALLGEFAEARQCFVEARRHAAENSDEMLESYYGEITSYDVSTVSRQTQLDLCIEALETYPTDLQLLCSMGGFLQAHDRADLATRTFETAVQCGQLNRNLWHLADMEDLTLACWTAAMQLQGRVNEAQQLLEGAVAERPESPRPRHQLIELYIAKQHREEALEHARQLPATMEHREAFYNAVRGACLATTDDWVAAEAYLESAYDAGCRDPICLRWLVVAWTQLRKIDQAELLLQRWRSVEPDNEEIDWLAERLPTVTSPSELLIDQGRRIRIHRPAAPGFDTLPRPKTDGATPMTPADRPWVDR